MPSSVTIVTAGDIQCFGYRDLADILSGVRDFLVSNDHNYIDIGSGGSSLPVDCSTDRILYFFRVRILRVAKSRNMIEKSPAGAGV